QSLESELGRVTGLFQETQNRTRDLVRRSSERFRQVWLLNEEEAKALVCRVLDADRIIHVQQLGMPWEEPSLGFMDNAGPLGGRREKKDAAQVAARLLEGGIRGFLGIFLPGKGSPVSLGSLGFPSWGLPGVAGPFRRIFPPRF
ncbi:DRC1 protein, partial [Paradoxornis webbianus]|nr:DRC1 protein [Sinosuthora webbiana]